MNAGIFEGGQHSHNQDIAIPTDDTGKILHVEGGEFVLPDEVSQDEKIYTLSGTNLEVIKQIFKILGLQWDAKITRIKSVDNIICIRSGFDPEVRTYTGTLQQIISGIQSSNGCTAIEGGAIVKSEETGEITIAPEPIRPLFHPALKLSPEAAALIGKPTGKNVEVVWSEHTELKDGGRHKHASKTYRNIDGINYQQWMDGISSSEDAKSKIVELEKEFPQHIFVFRKISDGYRIYRSAEAKMKDGDKPLLAPNGKPSNLNARQWHLVRTPEFKKWFGDWEKNPSNASSVVDKNGEPLILYHGSKEKFTVFDKSKSKDTGFHFGTEKQAKMRNNKYVIPVFLNSKQLKKVKDSGDKWQEKISKAKSQDFDGIIYLNRFEGITTHEFILLKDKGIDISIGGLDAMSDSEFKKNLPSSEYSYGIYPS